MNTCLAARGYRFTSQRERVYQVLLDGEHPTAEQVFLRAKERMPDISMATVYNCLDALVQSGLVRQVPVDPAAMRYCANMEEHAHFLCAGCGRVQDLPFAAAASSLPVRVPEGFEVSAVEVSVRGLCPECARKSRAESGAGGPGRKRRL